MPNEHRKHSRLLLVLEAQIHFPDGNIFNGATKNISFGGCFFSCHDIVGHQTTGPCLIEITSKVDNSGIVLSLKSTILRLEEDGAGIKFKSIDIHDYHHFRNIMVFNSPDPTSLLDELEKNPGLIVD